jgi:hypothetical protein
MREFETPLAERQRIARYYRERYWSDPEFRLRKLNRSRQGLGLPPRKSVDEIRTKGPLWELD